MRHLRDRVDIEAPVEAVWAWIIGLADHYEDWHPDHVYAQWLHGSANQVGSVLEAVEYLGGRRETLRFEMTELEAPCLFRYRVQGLHSMIMAGGAFEVEPDDGGSVFTTTLSFRGGAVIERLFRRRLETLRRHMWEEGENLKRILEETQVPSIAGSG